MAKESSRFKFLSLGTGMKSLALLGAGLLSSPSHAACTRVAVDLPVTMADSKAMVLAKINGTEVPFVIDSGAFYSLMSQGIAQEFKLRTRNAPLGLRINGIGGVAVPTIATVKAFSLKDVTMTNVEFLVVGGHFGGSAAGVIGQNLFRDRDVEFNLAQGMIRVMKDEDCGGAMLAYWVKPDDPVSLIDIAAMTPSNPHIIGSAYVNGVKIRVIFDTGAMVSILTRRAAERAGINFQDPAVTDGGLIAGVGSGVDKSYVVPVASFKFEGGEEIRRTRLRVADMELQDGDMLLGADFFLSHRIFIAHSQKKLYITYNGGPVFNLANRSAVTLQNASDSSQNAPEAQQEPADAAAWARRGTAFAGRRNLDRAIADLTRACDLEPANPEYFFERGRIYRQKHDATRAMADFDRVLELKPDQVQALLNRAELRLNDREIAGARADLDAIDKIVAQQAQVRFDMALDYEQANLMPAVIKQVDLWIPSHAGDSMLPVALRARCRARAVMGQELPQAVKDCDRAVSGSTKGANPLIMESRGFLFLRLGNYQKAIADYDDAITINPQYAMALYGRGIAELKTKNAARGEADISAAENIEPKIAETFKAAGITP